MIARYPWGGEAAEGGCVHCVREQQKQGAREMCAGREQACDVQVCKAWSVQMCWAFVLIVRLYLH